MACGTLSLDADSAEVWRHFWRVLFDLVCAPEEARRIGTVREFYRCSTAKEALLKAAGAGIREGLKSFDGTKAKARAPPGRMPG
jgi:4'-phosphopantetheinyl transferase